MIIRIFLAVGLVLLGVTSWFIVVQQPPAFQAASPFPDTRRLQKAGILPTGMIEENPAIEDGIFVVPPMDAMMLKQAKASAAMGGMDMSGAAGSMAGTAMNKTADMAGTTMAKTTDMAGTTMAKTADMAGTTMAKTADMAGTDMAKTADMAGTTMAKTADMAGTTMAKTADMAGTTMATNASAPKAEGGLAFSDNGSFDREITLKMFEWGFSDLNIKVKKGERIKFTVRNTGTDLHEFMFMTMPAMQAVTYRAKRADWNLLEHKALYEQSLILPGAEFSFVVEVQQDGMWMFMCMLPYHMQMGMMGQMTTGNTSMKM